MPQHQVPQQHPTQQQLHQQQQYQNMSWNTIPPKEASMDSWDSWQAQPQSHPTTASTTQVRSGIFAKKHLSFIICSKVRFRV